MPSLLLVTSSRYSSPIDGDPATIAEHSRKFGLEEIVAKKKNSVYEPGKRSGAWTKFRLNQEDNFAIGGFRPGKLVDSILVGCRHGRRYHFAGEVHVGLNRFNRQQLATILAKVPQHKCPFANLPDRRPDRWGQGIMPAHMAHYIWLKPTTSVRIAFVEWTLGGRLRHPRFQTVIS